MRHFRCLAVLTLLTLLVTGPVAAETWKLTSLNWQPYSGAEMASQGNSIQKLRMLLEEAGITLVVEFYPWKRAQYLAGKPDYVGYFPAWPEEVTEGFIASPPVDWSVLGYVVRDDTDVKFDTVEDLFENYKVGIVSTYVYPEKVQAAMKAFPKHVDKNSDEVSLLKKLSGGRFQVAMTDPNVTMYLAGKEGISNVKPLKQILEDKPLVISFRKGADNQKRIDLLKKLIKK
ncbi:MAG: ABC transporter substrate-binding protein [Desulfobacterales bacterium]|nr:ABC transporter substrate-binding protein [Desulfobacterales bacterium]